MDFRFQIPHSCNMVPKCQYCSVKNKFEKTPVDGDFGQWWNGIQQLQNNYPGSRFCFIYGEPFSFLNLVSWMGMISQKDKVDCVSNIINTYDMVKKYFINPKNLILTASYHPHYWVNIDVFYKEIEKICSLGVNLNTVFLLGYPPYIQHLNEWESYFKNRNLRVFTNAFYGEFKNNKYPSGYTEEEKSIVLGNNFGNDVINVQTKGRICNAGKDVVFIKWNGDVTSCYGSKFYSLGNILTNKIILFDKPMPCLNDTCDCPDMFVNYLID